ncbi:uncharacterized protein LOC128237844 [Mya arenaria]|uniref:uncharacterized protein LOC128237844 n=1 Tax=Mya arenaria TaxID=6604 RepID=UPI0022E76D4E|nr:uncharacterized protein LOC128237844 [Mya arenaria]
MSVYKASREYGVPESTLRDRTLGQQPTGDLPYAGPGPLFSKNEESQPVEHVAYMARIGYGYSRQEFMSLATDYAISLKKKIEMDSPLAPSWFNGFRKRNPEVTMTKPQKLSVIRAKCTSEEVLNNYFKELDKVLKAHNLHESPESIWNIDESGLQTEHSPRKILCMQGEKANTVTSNRGQTVTLTGCGSASGVHVPPYYVFPGKRWNENLIDGATPGHAGTMSDSGRSNSSVFLKYLENHFLHHVNTRDRLVLVLFDGHKSHVNLTLANWGQQHNVVFFVLPPHTSHVTQSLDVGCFWPFEKLLLFGMPNIHEEESWDAAKPVQ